MNTKLCMSKFLILTCIIVSVVLLLSGCGSSRQTAEGEDVNIDDLLGEENTSTSTPEQNPDEDEVLRLLGITPQETQPEPAAASTGDPEQVDQGEVNKLQDELMEKDQEISTLRSEITQKESKISDLQSQVESSKRRPGNSADAPSDFKSRYQSALNQFNSRNYQGALSSFMQLIASDPNTSLSDNCQYWIGESYYAMSNYNQAIAEFEKVFSFPNSNKTDDAQLKLGLCYMKLGDKQQARAEFDRLISNYPKSEYISLAQRYIARL